MGVNPRRVFDIFTFFVKTFSYLCLMVKPENDISEDEVRQEILRSAMHLYLKHGPDKVTMDDVAGATGRSRTSLYYYYKNHSEIYQAVLATMSSDSAERFRKAVKEAHTLEDKINAFFTAKLKTHEEWKAIHKKMWVTLNAEDQSKQSKRMTALHKELMQQESAVIQQILTDAAKRGEIRPIKPADKDMFAFILSTSIRGIRNEISDLHDSHDITGAVHLLTEIVMKWLTK
jgi:AcrR family transcriptional regulator